jgi:hypothetical protein
MATVSLTTVVNAALNFLGILDSGGSATTQQLADALPIVNDLIRNKSYDRLLASTVTIQSFSVTAGVQGYSQAAGPEIISGVIKLATGFTNPLKIVDATEWGMIPDRDRSSFLVKVLFYNRASSGANIFLSPIPLAGSVEYITWAPMSTFPDVTTTITVQDAYERWLKLITALEIAPAYLSAQVGPVLLQNIAEATATLRNGNASLFGEAPESGQVSANAQPPQTIKPIAAEGG